jgi:hypothetical protein
MTKKLTDSESQAQQNSPKKSKKWVGSVHNTSDIGYDEEWYDDDVLKKDK